MANVKISGFGRPGFVKDIAEYDAVPEAFNEVQNVRFSPVGAQTFAGHSSVLSPAAFNPLWLRVFPPVDNPLWVYAGLDKVMAFSDGHIDISRLSAPYQAEVQERWTGDVFQGLGILNNVIDVPQLWPQFDASERLIDLPNWPSGLRCKSLRPFKNFLIALHTIESGNARPYRFRWSHPAAPGTYPSSWVLNDPTKESGEKDIAETSDYLVDGLGLGDLFIIYKQKTAYAAQYVGRPDIFAHWQISASKGLLWRDCVTNFPGGHFVAGVDDLYVHTGQRGSEQSLVEARLRDWIFNQIDSSNFFNCYNVLYTRRSEIWFCFPEAGETYPTIAVVWNWITNGIGIRELPRTPFIYPGPIAPNVEEDIWGEAEVEAPVLQVELI